MELTLLPLKNDEVIRVRCEGSLSRHEKDDPLQVLLGPHCYSHKVLLNLERSQVVVTSGISWLIGSHQRFKQAGGCLVLFSVPAAVMDVLNFVRLTTMLNIAQSEKTAVEMAQEAAGEKPSDGVPSAIRFPR